MTGFGRYLRVYSKLTVVFWALTSSTLNFEVNDIQGRIQVQVQLQRKKK